MSVGRVPRVRAHHHHRLVSVGGEVTRVGLANGQRKRPLRLICRPERYGEKQYTNNNNGGPSDHLFSSIRPPSDLHQRAVGKGHALGLRPRLGAIDVIPLSSPHGFQVSFMPLHFVRVVEAELEHDMMPNTAIGYRAGPIPLTRQIGESPIGGDVARRRREGNGGRPTFLRFHSRLGEVGSVRRVIGRSKANYRVGVFVVDDHLAHVLLIAFFQETV